MSSPCAGLRVACLRARVARGGLAIAALAWAATALAQAVLWQRSPATPAAAPSGLALAFPAPGVVVAAGNTAVLPWLAGFSTAGTALEAGAPAAAPRPSNGVVVAYESRATALAPGFGGAILAGWTRTCTYIPPVTVLCSGPSPWVTSYSALASPRWWAPAAGSAAVAADAARAIVVGGDEARVQQFDAGGTLLADARPLPGGSGAFLDVSAFPGGGAVAAGASTAGPLLQRFAPNGSAAWAETVVAALDAATRLEKVVADPSGNIYAAGTRPGAGAARDIVLAKFGGDGQLVWTRSRAGVVPSRTLPMDGVTGLVLDGAANPLLAATASAPLDMVAWTAKWSPAGDLLWSDVYSAGPDARTAASAIGIDAHGQVFVGGVATRSAPVAPEGYVRKLGPQGTALWTARWEGRIADVAVGPDDEVVVLADVAQGVALMRLDPGAGEGAALPALLLVMPARPPISGAAVTLAVTVRGAATPTGVVTFRVNGADACTNVPLAPSTAPTARAECAIAQGLAAGTALVDVVYGGDVNNAAASASGRIVVAAAPAVEIPAVAPASLVALGLLLAWSASRRLRRG